jgi:hypothetical protein
VGLSDAQGNVTILLDKLSRIGAAIENRSHAKFFHQNEIGQTCLFAFDESKRMLAVYASTRVCLTFPDLFSQYRSEFSDATSRLRI